MTFEQLVEKGKQGQWMTAEAASQVSDEAKYGDGALSRWADAIGVSPSYAARLIKAWEMKKNVTPGVTLSPAAAMELTPMPTDKRDAFLVKNSEPTKLEARTAAEPYREKKAKSSSINDDNLLLLGQNVRTAVAAYADALYERDSLTDVENGYAYSLKLWLDEQVGRISDKVSRPHALAEDLNDEWAKLGDSVG